MGLSHRREKGPENVTLQVMIQAVPLTSPENAVELFGFMKTLRRGPAIGPGLNDCHVRICGETSCLLAEF